MSGEIKDNFLKDVSRHEMSVLMDNDLYRHIRFKRPDSIIYYFDIITWPGKLCITGDMGTYVFARIPDMFEFFRSPRRDVSDVNLPYWAEKIQAADRSGVKKFSSQKFRQAIEECIQDMDILTDLELGDDVEGLRQRVEDEVLSCNENEYEAVQAAMDFTYNGTQPFQDFWDVSIKEYTYSYTWCCYAIVWGIMQYDGCKPCPAGEGRDDAEQEMK